MPIFDTATDTMIDFVNVECVAELANFHVV